MKLFLILALALGPDIAHSWVLPQQQARRTVQVTEKWRNTLSNRNAVGSSALHMALVPLQVDDLEELLVVGPPSGPQYATYWGRTKVRAGVDSMDPLEQLTCNHLTMNLPYD
jgi:hypothetical protein